ncbi:hypothetical protein BKA80DRAFT_278514 [Phyllosticta citrichinensis]
MCVASSVDTLASLLLARLVLLLLVGGGSFCGLRNFGRGPLARFGFRGFVCTALVLVVTLRLAQNRIRRGLLSRLSRLAFHLDVSIGKVLGLSHQHRLFHFDQSVFCRDFFNLRFKLSSLLPIFELGSICLEGCATLHEHLDSSKRLLKMSGYCVPRHLLWRVFRGGLCWQQI